MKKILRDLFAPANKNTLLKRIMLPSLASSLVVILAFTILLVVSIGIIRRIVAINSDTMVETSAKISEKALEKQLTDNIKTHAKDLSTIIDQRLLKMENMTTLVADSASNIYSYKNEYRPQSLPIVANHTGPAAIYMPYIYFSPDANIDAVLGEARLAANVSKTLQEVFVLEPAISSSYIAGETGYFVVSDDDLSILNDYDPRNRNWYTGAKEAGTIFWSDVFVDISGRGLAVGCSCPFFDNGGANGGAKVFKGVAGNGIIIKHFSEIINSAVVGDNSIVFLLDNTGRKLFSSDGTGAKANADGSIYAENYLYSSDRNLQLIAKSMMRKESGLDKIFINGKWNYIAYNPLATVDWSVGILVDATYITKALSETNETIYGNNEILKKQTSKTILFISIATVLISLSFLIFRVWYIINFARRITAPIAALVSQIEQISGGDIDKTIFMENGTDELNQLSISFNNMTKRLKKYAHDLASSAVEGERIKAELDVAARIQTDMLPKSLPGYLPGQPQDFDLFAEMHPAKEVGGDFFDYFYIDRYHLVIVIADVSGKGVPAAMFTIIAKTLLKNHLQEGLELEKAAAKLNKQLVYNNNEGLFVTMWIAVFNPVTGKLQYVNAGHNPPLLKAGNFSFRFIAGHPSDLVIGAMEETQYHAREIQLSCGDELFLYTDGIPEAFNRNGQMYSEERLKDFMNLHYKLPCDDLLHAISDDVKEFSQGVEQSDDITMLVLRYLRKKDTAVLEDLDANNSKDGSEGIEEIGENGGIDDFEEFEEI
jgi:sigma-B regulation protein RsbU (phosphoserine phosphatase)